MVTGGAGIIGTAVCRGLSEHGAAVAVVDIDGAAARHLAEDITAGGGTALGVECDVTDPTSVAEMVDQIEGVLGPIDVLHNNAAGKSRDIKAFFAPFEDYSLEVWREITAVNLDGMFLVAQAVGRRMVERGSGGSVVQTGSIYGLVGPDPRLYAGSEYMGVAINTPAVYAATKASVIGLTRYLATYWAPHGIRVNALVPGGVESGQNTTFQSAYGARTPMGRMARREEMVGAVVFLASNAASYVTGQVLAVDGGWTAW